MNPTEIDLERLLAPVSAEAPAGVSLRYEGTYDRVREARREDDPTLPQGVWVTRLKAADWRGMAAICAEALERRSKDLQLAVWLAEAWLQLGGVAALAPGLRLVAGLCDRYWDAMFPELGDEGADPRENLLTWLDDAVARKLRLLPLPQTEGQPPFCLADWEAGRRPAVESSGAEGEEGVRELQLARATLVDRARWTALHGEVGAALAAIEALDRSLAARFPSPPVLHRTRGVLVALVALVVAAIGEVRRDEPAPAHAAGDSPTGAGAIADALLRPPGDPIRSRAEAYRQLGEAADYLLRTEPHSPVPYLVKRAIGWGNMSLAELLGEFVMGADDLVTIHRLLGIRGRDDGST